MVKDPGAPSYPAEVPLSVPVLAAAEEAAGSDEPVELAAVPFSDAVSPDELFVFGPDPFEPVFRLSVL